jgi:hypothetical protein
MPVSAISSFEVNLRCIGPFQLQTTNGENV